MDPQFKAMVVDEWTANSTTAAWRKWHPKFAVQLAAMTAALVDAAGIKPGMRVLDIASELFDCFVAQLALVNGAEQGRYRFAPDQLTYVRG